MLNIHYNKSHNKVDCIMRETYPVVGPGPLNEVYND